jgi:hypothetical protein
MQTVYLDQQIVISSFDDGEVAAAIEAGKRKGIIFPYSPAHVEEIAEAHHRHNREDALPQIPALDKLIPNPFEADSLGFPRADFSDSPSRADGGL